MNTHKPDIRDQILDSASSIFSRFGFKKTTMDEIARHMRKGKSSIYYYFTSKEEIYEAVIEKEAEQLRREVIRAISLASEPQEKLKAYILARMKTFRKLSNFYDALRNEYLSHLDSVEKIRRKYDREEIHILQDLLQEGIDRKAFNIKDPELAAIAIVTALKGLEVPMFWSENRTYAEDRMEELINILFYGLIKR
jgi:AcrR family transcriptional regulator